MWATFLLCFVKKQKIKLQHRKFGLFLACIKQYVLFFPFNLMVVWYMIMASGPITSWQIDGETMETVRDFVLEGSKITADGDWSHDQARILEWVAFPFSRETPQRIEPRSPTLQADSTS